MAPSILAVGNESLRRSLQTQVSVGSTSFSLSAIIRIAIGGALSLFAILTLTAMVFARRKHRLEMKQMSEIKEHGVEDVEVGKALRSTRPPEICFSRRLSFNSFLNLDDGISSHDWASQNLAQIPDMAKVKRRSTHLGFMRRSGARDSWPLVSNIQMTVVQGKSTIMQSQVASPGYVVEDPKAPKRSSSRLSRRSTICQVQINPDSTDPFLPSIIPTRILHRRSTSENQLSTILRSTSQRLKAAHRRSLTRTMSVLGRYPGLPPTDRLPTPPGRLGTESREALVGRSFSKSVAGSICNSYRSRSLSPPKRVLVRSSQPAVPRPSSPAPSNESRDSLCGAKTLDLVIPASLTSPRKHLHGERRHKMQLSTGSAKDISVMIHNDTRPSLEAIGGQDPLEEKKGIQRISLASDPFYSFVKNLKPIIPSPQIQGPRPQPPLYIRKATFGQEATSERPQSFCSPLKDVSGNAQHTPKNSQSESPATNPFQWSPQEAMQARATQTSPVSRRPSQRRKGHKRSNVIRMSVPRPLSSVEMVPEESDEDSPLSLESPRQSAMRRLEPTKNRRSPSPGSRLSARPPSSAIFNPALRIPAPTTRSEDNSPTLGLEDIRDGTVYSPTLSVCNYYTESGGASEDEFFRDRTSEQVDKTRLKSRRHGRNYSADLSLFPTHQSQQERQIQLTSIPPPSLAISSTPVLTPPFGRPLPSIDFSMSGGGVQLHSSATAAPPLLTLSTPTHLSGPRPEPPKSHNRNHSNTNNNRSPQRISVEASVALLRRMNSEVSYYSAASSPSETNSPVLPDNHASISSLEQFEELGRSRPSSKYYLSLGFSNLAPKENEKVNSVEKTKQRVVEKRDSHRVYKERRKKRNEEIERDTEGDGKDLTPVREVSSPATGANALGIIGLRFPTLSREGTNGSTPPRENGMGVRVVEVADETLSKSLAVRVVEVGDESLSKGERRWSNTMGKAKHEVIRRESKMEHPSPKTPPKWGVSGLGAMGLAGQRLMGGDKENREGGGRPASLGLYDQEGFLKSSPEREAVRAEKERERRDVKRLSGFVM
jgi:hypothetical protein